MIDRLIELYTSEVEVWLKRVLIVLCVSVGAFVVVRTTYTPPPVTQADVVVFVRNLGEQKRVTEVRKFVGSYSDSITLSRVLYEESNRANFFVVDGSVLDTFEGEYAVAYTTVLPEWVVGRWCIRTRVAWWPSWSQREHSFNAKDVCFETTEYE